MNRIDVSAQTSRQVSPLPPTEHASARPLAQRALMYGVPLGAAAVLGSKYGDKVYNTMKELASYGKSLTVNALAALRGIPPTTTPTTAQLDHSPSARHISASPTPLPLPTPDKHHPKTSIQ